MTISDIAKLAGVSVATVSRVLNNKGYVKAETKARIQEIISKNGYHPNAVARSLILNDTGMVAVIMSNRMNPFFQASWRRLRLRRRPRDTVSSSIIQERTGSGS